MYIVYFGATTKFFLKRSIIDTLRDKLKLNHMKFWLKPYKAEKEGQKKKKKQKTNVTNRQQLQTW